MKIKLISSFFFQKTNANALVINRKVRSLATNFNFYIYVNTVFNNSVSENQVKNINIKTFKSNLYLILQQFHKGKHDLIFSYHHDYTTVYGALISKMLNRKPWIAILSDPSHDISPFSNNISKSKLLVNSIIPMKIVARYADVVVFNDRFQLEFISKEYKILGKTITNQMGYEKYKMYSNTSNSDYIVFSYLGDLYGERNASELFMVINENYEYFQGSNIRFDFYGKYDFDPEDIFSQFPNILNIVYFYPRRSNQEIDSIISATSILLVIDANISKTHDIYPYTPSKIIDYIGTNKPILGISMEKSPTHDICLDSDNWWSDFDKNCILKSIEDISCNFRNYKRNHSVCDSFEINSRNKELIEKLHEFLNIYEN